MNDKITSSTNGDKSDKLDLSNLSASPHSGKTAACPILISSSLTVSISACTHSWWKRLSLIFLFYRKHLCMLSLLLEAFEPKLFV